MTDHAELKRLVAQGSLPPIVATLIAENEALRAQVQSMIDQTTPLVPVPGDPMWSRRITVDELQAEVEALRKEREGKVLCDLELFETLRDSANSEADEHRQCMATYRPLRQANLDSVVKKCDDLLAAMSKEG